MTVTQAPDLRPQMGQAFDQAAAVIAATRPDQLDLPTPCSDFDVAALLAHLVGVADRVAMVGRRQQVSDLAVPTGVAGDGWASLFAARAADALAVWEDDRLLDEALTLPFATLPGRAVVGVYLEELVTHSWDLARATGNDVLLDPVLAELALPIIRQALPASPRGGPIPFAPVVEVADDAPAYDRLAGWVGRDPAWG